MKIIKQLLAAALAVSALLVLSCGNPASGNNSGDNSGGDWEFLNRNLQGNFNGKAYEFVSGYAEESYWDVGAFDIYLYDIPVSDGLDPWSFFAYPMDVEQLRVSATVPAAVGVTELFFNMTTWENKTVNLYDLQDESLNILVHIGAVEILEINETEGTVSGRISASNGQGDSVNGNFTVPIAPAD